MDGAHLSLRLVIIDVITMAILVLQEKKFWYSETRSIKFLIKVFGFIVSIITIFMIDTLKCSDRIHYLFLVVYL